MITRFVALPMTSHNAVSASSVWSLMRSPGGEELEVSNSGEGEVAGDCARHRGEWSCRYIVLVLCHR